MEILSPRLLIFVGLWLLLALAEQAFAAGYRKAPRSTRWLRHLGLVGIGSGLIAIILPGGAIAAALWAQSEQIGLLRLLPLSGWLSLLASLLLFDLLIYFQHRAFHYRPLWRLHAVHHSDTSFDLSTGVRFHPLELLLSMGFKMVVAVALGAPPEAIVAYEIILSSMALFTHADLRLSEGLDRALRWLIVTPAMHRVHHSAVPAETNSNFGNALSVWDRLFGSYRQRPQAALQIGLERWREERDQRLAQLLALPFGQHGWGRRD